MDIIFETYNIRTTFWWTTSFNTFWCTADFYKLKRCWTSRDDSMYELSWQLKDSDIRFQSLIWIHWKFNVFQYYQELLLIKSKSKINIIYRRIRTLLNRNYSFPPIETKIAWAFLAFVSRSKPFSSLVFSRVIMLLWTSWNLSDIIRNWSIEKRFFSVSSLWTTQFAILIYLHIDSATKFRRW